MRASDRRFRAGLAVPGLVACLALAGLATPARSGPAGFAFLEIPSGARASALGGAYASLAEGAEASFWNPAGLATIKRLEMAGAHSELFERLRYDHFAAAFPAFGGGVSGSVRALYSEPIDERDELGNLIGTFGAHDLEFGLGYGRSAGAGLALGASASVVRERIANLSTTTYAFGAGAAWEPSWARGAKLAASAQGIGPSARYTIDGVEGEPVPLPAAIQAGASHHIGFGAVTLRGALEGRFTRGRNGVGMLGAELAHIAGAALRFGLRANDETSSFAAGVGYRTGGLELDYAFVPLRLDLGDSHRFAFRAAF